jgi:hypothetical protein
MEAPTGGRAEACPGVVEDRPGPEETHLGFMKAHHSHTCVEVHPGRGGLPWICGAHTGAVEAHLGDLDIISESWRLFLESWRLFLESWRLTLEAHPGAVELILEVQRLTFEVWRLTWRCGD